MLLSLFLVLQAYFLLFLFRKGFLFIIKINELTFNELVNLLLAILVSVTTFGYNTVSKCGTEEFVDRMNRHIQPLNECVYVQRIGKHAKTHYKQLSQLRSTVSRNATGQSLVHQHKPVVHLLVVGVNPYVNVLHIIIRKVLARETVICKLPNLD